MCASISVQTTTTATSNDQSDLLFFCVRGNIIAFTRIVVYNSLGFSTTLFRFVVEGVLLHEGRERAAAV